MEPTKEQQKRAEIAHQIAHEEAQAETEPASCCGLWSCKACRPDGRQA